MTTCPHCIKLTDQRADVVEFPAVGGCQIETVTKTNQHAGHENIAEAEQRVALPANAQWVVTQVRDTDDHGQLLIAARRTSAVASRSSRDTRSSACCHLHHHALAVLLKSSRMKTGMKQDLRFFSQSLISHPELFETPKGPYDFWTSERGRMKLSEGNTMVDIQHAKVVH